MSKRVVAAVKTPAQTVALGEVFQQGLVRQEGHQQGKIPEERFALRLLEQEARWKVRGELRFDAAPHHIVRRSARMLVS